MTLHTNKNPIFNEVFFDEAFEQKWIIVTDRNGCNLYVEQEDLMEMRPDSKNNYIRVDYYGQSYWIHQDLHFPL
jgi:hypothetical protein